MKNQIHSLKVSLKALTSFPSKEGSLSSPTSPIMISNNIPLPTNSDNYIANESCIEFQKESHIDQCDKSKSHNAPSTIEENQAKAKSISKKKEKKVFPPPISLLARTQNLASYMPWILKRYYTSEGRLILKEEKVRHHEYCRAHRANGRLTLQLVPLDNDDDFLRISTQALITCSHHHEGVNEGSKNNNIIVINRFPGEKDKANILANHDRLHMEDNDNGVVGEKNGGLKYLKFNSVRSASSCIFGVLVHPIRTVHG